MNVLHQLAPSRSAFLSTRNAGESLQRDTSALDASVLPSAGQRLDAVIRCTRQQAYKNFAPMDSGCNVFSIYY